MADETKDVDDCGKPLMKGDRTPSQAEGDRCTVEKALEEQEQKKS